MHKNLYLIDMCILEGCTVLEDSCTECGTPDDWLSAMWPSLDDAIQAQCSQCADMLERIVWRNGEPVVEACPVCAMGDSVERVNDRREL